MVEPSNRRVDHSISNSASAPSGTPSHSKGKASVETKQGAAADSVPISEGAALPKNFGRYRVLKELGRGQMGAVYLAHDTELDRPVALKVARVSSSGAAKRLKRMEIEAKSAAKVDHPLICKVYDTGEIDGIRFIALQYVEGEDLKKYLAKVGRQLDPEEAIRLVLQILRALSAAHEKQVIHRDLKPENIMLNKNREPVIMDFGLARQSIGSSDAGLTQGMIVGTAAYMSPEQATGKAEGIDYRSDLYAVGVILFEMLTGEWPFTGGSVEVMGQKCVLEPPLPIGLNPNLHPQLSAVCHKMIAKKKENRFATCSEAIEALEAIDLNETILPESVFESRSETDVDFLNSPTQKPIKSKTTQIPTRTSPPTLRSKSSQNQPGPKDRQSKSLVARKETPTLPWPVLGGAGICVIGIVIGLFSLMASKPSLSSTTVETKIAEIEKTSESALTPVDNLPDIRKVDRQNIGQTPPETVVELTRTEAGLITGGSPRPNAEAPESTSTARHELPAETSTDAESTPKPDPSEMSGEETAAPATLSDDDPASTIDSLIEKAVALVKANQRKEALIPLKRASNLAPKDPRPDFYLGLLNLGWGIQEPKEAKVKLETSEMHFTRALNRTAEQTPERTATANNLALVELKLRKIPAARNYFEISTKQGQRPSEINHNLARVLGQPKTFDIKPVELKKIGALNVESTNARSGTGWLFLPLNASSKTRDESAVFCPRNSFEDPSCNVCNGCTKLLCIPCGGKGKIAVLGTSAHKTDMGFGMSANSTTMGTNLVVCSGCGGKGRVDCGACLDGRDRGLSR